MVEDRAHNRSVVQRRFGRQFFHTIEALCNIESGCSDYHIKGPVPAIAGLEHIGSKIIGDGTANFIQITIKDNPCNESYFRAGIKPHNVILEDFLEEIGIYQKNRCKVIGGGIIGEATITKRRRDYAYKVEGYFVAQSNNLMPDMMQILQIGRQVNMPIAYFETYGKNLKDAMRIHRTE